MWKLAKSFQSLAPRKISNINFSFRNVRMVAFNSIIVFDTETTGLPHLEGNNTRIIEMAMMGCETNHLSSTKTLPRVLHKLVLCFNPMKAILPDSSDISGLENELLMNIKPFTVVDVEVMTHFIKRLPSPVCMVAHNGYKFDFPILQKQLQKLNTTLPEDLYCADSLKAFHEIYPSAKQYTGASKKYEANEVTPKKIIPTSFPLKQPKIELIDLTEDVVPSKAVKNLFPDSPESKSSNNYSGGSEASFKKSSPLKYTLSSIYEFLHEKTFVNGHRAEDDAIALLSCIIKCDKFLSWMNEKAVPFNSIKPLHNIVASSQPRNSVEAK